MARQALHLTCDFRSIYGTSCIFLGIAPHNISLHKNAFNGGSANRNNKFKGSAAETGHRPASHMPISWRWRQRIPFARSNCRTVCEFRACGIGPSGLWISEQESICRRQEEGATVFRLEADGATKQQILSGTSCCRETRAKWQMQMQRMRNKRRVPPRTREGTLHFSSSRACRRQLSKHHGMSAPKCP